MDVMDVNRRFAQMRLKARSLTGTWKIVIGRRYAARGISAVSADTAGGIADIERRAIVLNFVQQGNRDALAWSRQHGTGGGHGSRA